MMNNHKLMNNYVIAIVSGRAIALQRKNKKILSSDLELFGTDSM